MFSHFGVPVQHFQGNESTAAVNNESRENQSVVFTEVLQLFDGRTKAVRRSSGGLVLAEPCQIVVVGQESPSRSNIRLRVRFKDISFEEINGDLISHCQTHTKVIALEDLRDPFSYNFNTSQQFVLDVGHGIVPVHVVHYDTDAQGVTYAYFVEIPAIESVLLSPSGQTRFVQPYRVPRSVLRFAGVKVEREGKSDYELSRENLERMERFGATLFPDCLKTGGMIEVPTGVGVKDLSDYLQLSLVQSRAEAGGSEPLFMPSLRQDEEEFFIRL